MGSIFGTYSIAYSGLYASQASLAATSTNLSNINTPGASRVRVATAEQTVASGATSIGTGTSVATITRARDQLLDSTYRDENADATYWSVKNGNLEYMQKLLSEFSTTTSSDSSTTSSTGIQQALQDFFDSWETLSTDSSSVTDRQAVTENAATLISTLSGIYSQLEQLQADAVTGVQDGVDALNKMAKQVADLNTQITQAEAGGGEASYLRDQRDELLDEMSAFADTSAVEKADGTVTVTIGGVTLVNGATAHSLAVEGDGSTTSPLTVKWANTDSTVELNSGSIQAYLEDADQSGYATVSATGYDYSAGATSSITNLRQGLNDLITTLALAVNTLHTSGVDLNGDSGQAFFTTVDASQPLSITNIQVNPDLVDDPSLVVTAAGSTSSTSGDNSIATTIGSLASAENYKYDGLAMSLDNFYANLISWIGTAGDNAASNYDTQQALVDQVDNQRQTTMSISMDEEMSNMIKYQEAYNANARVMSTMDQLLAALMDEIG